MMALVDLFFGPRGRINRAKYFLAVLLWSVVGICVITLVYFTTGSLNSVEAWILITIFVVPAGWSTLVLGFKRLHDRNKTGWWMLLFYLAPYVLNNIATSAERDGNFKVEVISIVVGLVIELWAFVELVCLRGTTGPNQYGPDPLTRDISTG
jgi:uncharacterized membrane protein YhaH (DUF805 family)